MRLPLRFALPARLAYGLFVTVSAFYCLLAWIPFTWQQVIQGHLIPALATFAGIHQWLNLGAVTLLACAVWEKRRAVRIFLGFQAALAVWLLARPALSSLTNDPSSLFWAALLILPLPWLGILDITGNRSRLNWAMRQGPSDSRAFHACWRAALFCGVLAVLISGASSWAPAAVLWSTTAHVVVFFWGFIAVALVTGLAASFARPARFEFAGLQVLACGLVYLLFHGKIFPAISFQGSVAAWCAAALAFSICVSIAGVAVLIAASRAVPLATGLDLAVLPAVALLPGSWAARAAGVILLGAVTAFASASVSSLDWNYLIQELVALLCWVSAFALFYGFSATGKTRLRSTMTGLIAALVLSAGYAVAWTAFSPKQVLQDYAGHNISFRLASQFLSPPAEDGEFYAFLNASSNISRAISVKPVEIDLAGKLSARNQAKPNIFIIVVDSLRRDYLGVYNRAVTFTPSLDAFATESTVFRNAFTHYGATGLSEPSIWVGGMMLHKQYVTPFQPMNSLAKLVSAEGYTQFVSMDSILETVVPRGPQLKPLDEGRLTMDLDLCGSLAELQQRVSGEQPVFAYTQPQNLHVSVITRQGKSVLDNEPYPGFYAPYASRLRRIDACFGQFLKHLKAANLYDSSIVVFTADHGDSLGEEGRWGHAYTIFPEIVRIPLLIHLPPALRGRLTAVPDGPVFSTDITPTLYDLLGHEPSLRSDLFGRSLVRATPPRPSHLIASSYAGVYGLLTQEGRRLYISDPVSARDYLYDLTVGAAGRQTEASPEEHAASHTRIRQMVEEINSFYSFHPQAP